MRDSYLSELFRDGKPEEGDLVWLKMRRALSAEKLAAVVEMINSYGGLGLTKEEIAAVCDRGDGHESEDVGEEDAEGRILVAYGGERLTDDDFVVLEKIGMGTVIPVRDGEGREVLTDYAFTHGGKKYPAEQVSAIINRLNCKFALLDFHVDVKNTSRGMECGDTYPVLNKKARALLKERGKRD